MSSNGKVQGELRVFVVPADLLDADLDIYEKMVYVVLRAHCAAYESTAWPSYARIASLASISIRKAKDVIASLEQKGLIEKESRPKYSKNRKISNDSNKYTVKNVPDYLLQNKEQNVVGGAQYAPGVVHSMHQGGAQRAPEQNHLTNTYEQNHRTTTDGDVDDLHKDIETVLGVAVTRARVKELAHLGRDYLLSKARFIAANRSKYGNVAGAWVKACKDNWDTDTMSTDSQVGTVKQGNALIQENANLAFYRLYPDMCPPELKHLL